MATITVLKTQRLDPKTNQPADYDARLQQRLAMAKAASQRADQAATGATGPRVGPAPDTFGQAMADYLDPRNASTALLNNAEGLAALVLMEPNNRLQMAKALARAYAPKSVADALSAVPSLGLDQIQAATNSVMPDAARDLLRHQPRGPFGQAGIVGAEQATDPLNLVGGKALRLIRR